MVRDTFDEKKLLAPTKGNVNVLIGYRSGIPHINPDGSAGPDVADLARMLSVGSDRTPDRPHLEPGILNGRNEINRAIQKHYEALVETGMGNPDLVGVVAVGQVQVYMRGTYLQETAPLSEKTIKARQDRLHRPTSGDKPLIDTGDMIGALGYVVEKVKK